VNGFLNRTNVAKYLQRGHPYSIPYLVAKIFLTHKTALNILRPTKRKFLSIPEEWISLRTTNIIERLNKEFRRRTKVMEIVAGEIACYRILAYISLKMEMHWRSSPVGKVRKNLPFFKELAYEYFTQKT